MVAEMASTFQQKTTRRYKTLKETGKILGLVRKYYFTIEQLNDQNHIECLELSYNMILNLINNLIKWQNYWKKQTIH